MRRFVMFAFVSLMLLGCSAVYVKAPPGKTVTLMSNEVPTVRMEFRQVSLLWGLIPLANQPFNTAGWIKQVNLGQVRVKTYYKWYEFLWDIPAFLFLGLHTNTVLLEGNPPPVEQP